MTTSARIQEALLDYLSDQQEHSVQGMKRHLSEVGLEDYTEGQFAGSINTMLRNGSIRKVDRGIYSIALRRENMKTCFVVSPIGEENSDTRINADKLFKHIIKPVCNACDFDPIRVDKLNDANSITQTIIEHLEKSELVIADITELNPNVFYEMGYRARTQKPLIHLKRKGERLPFDVTTIRTLEYDLTDLDSVEEIKERLTQTIESFDYSDSSESVSEEPPITNSPSTIMPVLYEILDSINEVKREIQNNNAETLTTVIRSMQPTQPQVSPETAMQMQLLGSFVQNPEAFMKLVELVDKTQKGKK